MGLGNVSICNNKGLFYLLTVTDRDGRLAADEKSQSVTSGGWKLVYLLQIEIKAGRVTENLNL